MALTQQITEIAQVLQETVAVGLRGYKDDRSWFAETYVVRPDKSRHKISVDAGSPQAAMVNLKEQVRRFYEGIANDQAALAAKAGHILARFA